jgi:hypothetical protein
MAGPLTPLIPYAITGIKGYLAQKAAEKIPGADAVMNPGRYIRNRVIDQLPEDSRENARKVMDAVTDPVGSAIKAGGRAINNQINPDLNAAMDRQTAMNADAKRGVQEAYENKAANALPGGISDLIRPKAQAPVDYGSMSGDQGYFDETKKMPGFEYNESPVSDMPENADIANYDMDSIGSMDFKKGGRVKARKPAKRTTMSTQSSASKRGDGIAQRGKTRGRYI